MTDEQIYKALEDADFLVREVIYDPGIDEEIPWIVHVTRTETLCGFGVSMSDALRAVFQKWQEYYGEDSNESS